jgi:tight adherence protein B
VASGGLALFVLGLSLLAALAGVSNLVRGRAERELLLGRTAFERAEARAVQPSAQLAAALRRTRLMTRIAARLAIAGVDMGPIQFAAIAVGAGFVCFLVAGTIMPTLLALAAGAGGVRAAWGWVQRKQAQRTDRFVAQLPELARVLSNAASAGLAIRTALERAGHELDDPAGAEMRLTSEELRIGQSVEGALANLERRLPSREVGVLASTIVIQQRAGGSLVKALRSMAETLEGRKDLRREIRTVMAGSVFTGYLVAGMGVGTVILVNAIKPGALDKLTSSIIGQVVLAVVAGLYFLGFVLIRLTTRIET